MKVKKLGLIIVAMGVIIFTLMACGKNNWVEYSKFSESYNQKVQSLKKLPDTASGHIIVDDSNAGISVKVDDNNVTEVAVTAADPTRNDDTAAAFMIKLDAVVNALGGSTKDVHNALISAVKANGEKAVTSNGATYKAKVIDSALWEVVATQKK